MQAARAVAPGDSRHPIVVKRLRFASEPPPGAQISRETRRSWSCVAAEEVVDIAALRANNENMEAVKDLIIVLIPSEVAAERARMIEGWLGEDDVAASMISVAVGEQKIKWRPGCAIVHGPAATLERTLEALARFAFGEGELRRLEDALDDHDAQAHADVAWAHVVRFADRKHWPRLTEQSGRFRRMRLTYARLAANLATALRGLSPEPRQLINRLVDKANISARLEAVSDRIEACEDLYDGATDRIAEYRWFLVSWWLEVGIILLLLVDIGLTATGVYHFYLH